MTTRRALVVGVAALVVGLAIYLVARRGTELHALLGIGGGTVALPGFVRDNLPDALWQFAFCVAVLAIWQDAPRSAWRALPLAIGLGAELAQATGVVPGTFDLLDLGAMAIASWAAAIVMTPRQPETACDTRSSTATA
ncbi:MAG TPA: hypothetical protein VFQ53_01635 [Kofleriaceae bacterium]|nr:hypothetical protein [Kofleriaceae bacterium]